MITAQIVQISENEGKLEKLIKDLNDYATRQASQFSKAESAMQGIEARLSGAVVQVKDEATDAFTTLRAELMTRSVGLKMQLDDKIGEFSRDGRAPRTGDEPRPHGEDKKEGDVWRLADNLDKASFRHWIEAVSLEAL